MIERLARALIPSPLRPFSQKLYRFLARPYRQRAFAKRFDSAVLQCRIAYNRHGGYCVPLSSLHRPAVQAILAGDVWEAETIDFMAACNADDDLIHAGTFFGDFLPALSRSRRGEAKVWAFEPNPESYRCASVTMAINGLQNVVLTNAGLGERPDTLVLETRTAEGIPLGGGSRILTGKDAAGVAPRHTQEVQVLALDTAVPEDRRVSLIQLDVEGFETQALTGARNIIRRCLPVIVLETMPNNAWLSENLWPLGYRLGPVLHDNTILLPPDRAGDVTSRP
jgi:FkbM family methyltransferase